MSELLLYIFHKSTQLSARIFCSFTCVFSCFSVLGVKPFWCQHVVKTRTYFCSLLNGLENLRMSYLSKRILQAPLLKMLLTNKKESNALFKEAQFKIHELCRQSVHDAPRHLAWYSHQGGCFIWGASVSVGNSRTSTSAGLMEIISSTEKLAVLVTHVSVSHKLCQRIQFLPYSASAKPHEENSEIVMEFANFTNTMTVKKI